MAKRVLMAALVIILLDVDIAIITYGNMFESIAAVVLYIAAAAAVIWKVLQEDY